MTSAPEKPEGSWRPGASWRNQAPASPQALRERQRKRRIRRSGGAGQAARFFTKQVLWLVLLAFVLVVVDLFLYILIATHEMDRSYLNGTPSTVAQGVDEGLTEQDGSWTLDAQAAALLDENGAWAQLIAADGSVAWSYQVPADPDGDGAALATGSASASGSAPSAESPSSPDSSPSSDSPSSADSLSSAPSPSSAELGVHAMSAQDPGWGRVPGSYGMSDVALMAHYRQLNGYPIVIWDRDDGLLVIGFPIGSYETMAITWPEQTWQAIPGYVLSVLGLDLVILFAAYLVYRRRTQRAVVPLGDALGVLAQGGRVELQLQGDLQPIADRINETSDILERKDTAREQWIRGVSHDIRTPLSVIIGKADAMASSEQAPEPVRAEARAIRTQGLKIKDLVADLNTASQLSFGNRPLNIERVPVAKMLRNVAASYLNSGFDSAHPLEFQLDERCADAVVMGDERMLARMVENLLANARLHNPDGCTIALSLSPDKDCCTVQVADDGCGMTVAQLAELQARLTSARLDPDAAVPNAAGHGLGLALVDRIARAHDGELSIDASEGAGFTARVRLPLASR